MPALAMGIGFLGYSVGLWGYCLLRGYDVTIGSLMSPLHPPSWSAISGSQIPIGQVFPSGNPAGALTPGQVAKKLKGGKK